MFTLIIKTFNCIKYRIRRLRSYKMFISAIDLMQPVNGHPTAAQLTIISRMLDIELIRLGKESWWDVKINQCHNKTTNTEEEEAFHLQAKRLVYSMDKYGWDYYLSQVNVNRNPFFVYNGTHRLAYTLLKNPFQMIPVVVDEDGWLWSKEEGYSYFLNLGLHANEVDELMNRYNEIVKKYHLDNIIIFPSSYYQTHKKIITNVLSDIGTIVSCHNLLLNSTTNSRWLNALERKFFKHNHKITAIRIAITNKDYRYKNRILQLISLENILHKYKIKDYIYSSSITKTIEFNVWLKENATEI